jgi:hypothetical protein
VTSTTASAVLVITLLTGEGAPPDVRGALPPPDADAAVSGVVTRDGFPVAEAHVVARTILSDEEAPVGAPVETKVVSSARSRPDGSFVLPVDRSDLDLDHVAANGRVNLMLNIADRAHEVVWFVTATPTDARPSSMNWTNDKLSPREVTALQAAGKAPIHLFVDMGVDPRIVEEGVDPARWVGPDGRQLGAAAARVSRVTVTERPLPAGDAPTSAGCTGSWGDWVSGRTERVARLFGLLHAKPYLEQTASSRHTLGVGFTASGEDRAWSQGGTQQVTAGAADTGTYLGIGAWAHNKVDYRYWYQVCPFSTWTVLYPLRVHSLASSANRISAIPDWNKSANCTLYRGNGATKRFKSSGTNLTQSAGVNLGAMRVSSQSGWNSNTRIWWVIDEGKSAYFCGSTSAGWVSSPEAGVFSWVGR